MCEERWTRKDAETLRAFFGQFEQAAPCIAAIRRSDTDKLKPLSNFLGKKTTNTDLKNIELLAWLLDFPDRPFNSERNYAAIEYPWSNESNSKQQPASTSLPSTGDSISTFVIPPVQKKGWLRGIVKPKTWTVGAGLLLLTASGTYLGVFHNRAGAASSGNNQCMVWQEDHYELTDCNHPAPGKLVVAADPDRIKNFRKIGDAYVDTITARSIGQLWYLKKDNKLEYFTCRGMHPIFTDKALKPLSLYMYSKYIHPERSADPQFSSSRMR